MAAAVAVVNYSHLHKAAVALAEFAAFAFILRRAMVFLDHRPLSLAKAVMKPPVDALKLFRRGS